MRKDQETGINWQEPVTVVLQKDQINTLVCYIIKTGQDRMEEISRWKEYLEQEGISEVQKRNVRNMLQSLEEKDRRLGELVNQLNQY